MADEKNTDETPQTEGQTENKSQAVEQSAVEDNAETVATQGASADNEGANAKKSVGDLSDLKDIAGDTPDADAAAVAQSTAPLREQELDKQGRAYATGRRKDATARVWLKPGKGQIIVNGKDQEAYFARPTLRLIIDQPFAITDRQGQYDVVATVKGGGLSGQAGAVKHGISQALAKYEPALRSTVKAAGFLTRDSRVVERKKYGRAKARRSFQFSKR